MSPWISIFSSSSYSRVVVFLHSDENIIQFLECLSLLCHRLFQRWFLGAYSVWTRQALYRSKGVHRPLMWPALWLLWDVSFISCLRFIAGGQNNVHPCAQPTSVLLKQHHCLKVCDSELQLQNEPLCHNSQTTLFVSITLPKSYAAPLLPLPSSCPVIFWLKYLGWAWWLYREE